MIDTIRCGASSRGRLRAGATPRNVSTIDLPKDLGVTIDDLYDKLGELRAGPVRVLRSEDVTMVLLKSRAIMEYNNGGGWYAIHPLVAELLASRDG